MLRTFLIGGFMLLALAAHAAEPRYPHEVAQWEEVSIPPESSRDARSAWLRLASFSSYEWRVYTEGAQVYAQHFAGGRSTARARVYDGGLVGVNNGEFGAALNWVSTDGKSSYKISDHQVVDFFSLPDGLYAIEGLAHMWISRGSVIRIDRPPPYARWQAATVTELPSAPYAVSVRRDGTALITLDRELVQVDGDRRLTTLLYDQPWGMLYPNSSVLSPDEQKLYIGMRQFVGEFDIPTRKLRFLIPSASFLNKHLW